MEADIPRIPVEAIGFARTRVIRGDAIGIRLVVMCAGDDLLEFIRPALLASKIFRYLIPLDKQVHRKLTHGALEFIDRHRMYQ